MFKAMQETPSQEIEAIARRLSAGKTPWHFHLLTPGCFFNEFSNKFGKMHVFVLENEAGRAAYFSLSKRRNFSLGKKLLKLRHGIGFGSSDSEEGKTAGNPRLENLLSRARDLTERGISWHHHLFLPGCVFNNGRKKGKWVIFFEDPETGKAFQVAYPAEPKEELSRVEKLYYSQRK
ncbi:MAG: hypothetical protein V1820_05110 [archaeon]